MLQLFWNSIFDLTTCLAGSTKKAYLNALVNSKLLTDIQGIVATLAKHHVFFYCTYHNTCLQNRAYK
jgi:hypothetical protein